MKSGTRAAFVVAAMTDVQLTRVRFFKLCFWTRPTRRNSGATCAATRINHVLGMKQKKETRGRSPSCCATLPTAASPSKLTFRTSWCDCFA